MTDHPEKRHFEVLLTAQEAFPALEREFLNAQNTVIAGFRIFDPATKLHSEAAQAVGTDWGDLITATLNRGVSIQIILSDFDPVIGLSEHRYSWQCIDGLRNAADASSRPELFKVQAALHPARVGLLPRLLLWPRLIKEMRGKLADINTRPSEEKAAFLNSTPRLRDLIKWRGDTLVPKFGPPPLVPVTHHQKLAVFDETRLYIGGLDLNDRRYDTWQHDRAADETWHDAQVIVDGPVVKEAADHLRNFEATTQGARPAPMTQLLRTLSAKRAFALPYLSPRAVLSELADAHRDQAAKAQSLIYLESQFFRDRGFAEHLAAQAVARPDLCLILILPSAPEGAAFADNPGSDVAYGEYLQTKSLEIIHDGFGARAFVGSPAQPRQSDTTGRASHYGAPLIYLHAKVSLFDRRVGIISSANMNGRSLSWDTEAGIMTQTPQEAAQLQDRCFRHWLGEDADQRFHDVETAQSAWAALARQNASRTPEQRDGFMLPFAPEPARELGKNLPGVPEEMV